jgi:hypothetical protein
MTMTTNGDETMPMPLSAIEDVLDGLGQGLRSLQAAMLDVRVVQRREHLTAVARDDDEAES